MESFQNEKNELLNSPGDGGSFAHRPRAMEIETVMASSSSSSSPSSSCACLPALVMTSLGARQPSMLVTNNREDGGLPSGTS